MNKKNKLKELVYSLDDFDPELLESLLDDLQEEGCKMILKDDKPACYVVHPTMFEDMLYALEELEETMESFEELEDSDITHISNEIRFRS